MAADHRAKSIMKKEINSGGLKNAIGVIIMSHVGM
jgi:hypothetical protein